MSGIPRCGMRMGVGVRCAVCMSVRTPLVCGHAGGQTGGWVRGCLGVCVGGWVGGCVSVRAHLPRGRARERASEPASWHQRACLCVTHLVPKGFQAVATRRLSQVWSSALSFLCLTMSVSQSRVLQLTEMPGKKASAKPVDRSRGKG